MRSFMLPRLKFPSIGFVYLLTCLVSVAYFFYWATEESWYERVLTSRATYSDKEEWALHLEETAKYFSSKKKIEAYRKAVDIRLQLNQFDYAVDSLQKLLILLPDDVNIKSSLLQVYVATGKKEMAFSLMNNIISDVGNMNDLGIKAILATAVNYLDDKGLEEVTSKIFEQLDLSKWRSYGENIAVLGVASDYWTTDGEPAYILVKGNSGNQKAQEIYFSIFAQKGDFPIQLSVENPKYAKEYQFTRAMRIKFNLPPVSSGKVELYIINTNKTWIAKNGIRNLGVRITPVER